MSETGNSMLRRYCRFGIVLLTVLSVNQGGAAAAGLADSFLRLGPGARAMGMGGAFIALADDGTSVHWNPAGLGQLSRMQATYHHAFLFENLANHDFVNFTIPVSRQVVLGASWTRLDVSDTPRFATLTGSRGAAGLLPVGSRKDRSDAYVITLARMHHHPRLAGESGYLPVEMPYAVNLKVIRQAFGSDTATGIGIDAGYMLKIGLKDAFGSENAGHVSFGITGKDIIGTRVYWKTRGDETVKPSYRMGFSFTQPVAPINGTLVLAEQNSIYNGDSLRFGLEYWYAETVAIRIGNAEAFTIGAGLYFQRTMVDYAFQDQAGGGVHHLSVSLNL